MSGNFEMAEYRGVLSDRGIKAAIEKGDIYIAPFCEKQLQPSGYNLTPTRFVYSDRRKMILPVVKENGEVYVMIDPNDTVLVRTRESVAVSSVLSGAFFSKVKVVSEGFGHISTTLDPSWEGQLLISLNNPTKRKKKFSIEKIVYGETVYNSFVTLEFFGLDYSAEKKADNPSGRIDILRNTLERNVSTLFKKNKLEQLSSLIDELCEFEEEKIETIVLSMLNEDEQKIWENIQAIREEAEYELNAKKFLKQKEQKYLRMVKKKFENNALKSIELVNEYIVKKYRYSSLRSKFWFWCKKYYRQIIGVIFAVSVGVIYYVIIEKTLSLEEVAYIKDCRNLIGVCIIYIIYPAIKDIIVNLNPNN